MRTDPALLAREEALLAQLPEAAAAQARAQLQQHASACGCQEGAAFGFFSLSAVAVAAVVLGWGPLWLGVLSAVAAFVAGVGIGKYYGLASARRRREALVAALAEHVAESARLPRLPAREGEPVGRLAD